MVYFFNQNTIGIIEKIAYNLCYRFVNLFNKVKNYCKALICGGFNFFNLNFKR
jgi:hypothetical protein